MLISSNLCPLPIFLPSAIPISTGSIGFLEESNMISLVSCLITINEFQNVEGVLQVEIGDSVEVYVEALEADEDGVTYLSKRKAEKVRTWEKIGEIYEEYF